MQSQSIERYPPKITACANHIEERPSRYKGSLMQAIGGTALILEQGVPRATKSFLAYTTQESEEEQRTRPVIFVGNGGPSAPATLLSAQHFSGPLALDYDYAADGHLIPYMKLLINPDSFAENGDSVNFDPIGTGIGEMLDGEDKSWPHSVERDIQTGAAVIEWWLSDFVEEGRPIALVASSYAALRSTGIALELYNRGIPIDAMVFVSGAFDRRAKTYMSENWRAFATCLPTLALCARHYQQGWHEKGYLYSDAAFREVEEFARTDFVNLLRHNKKGRERRETIERLVDYLGLSREVVMEHDLRISPSVFAHELLKDRERDWVLSELDGRLSFADNRQVRIERALDEWEPVFKAGLTAKNNWAGFPNASPQDVGGIVQVSWPYSGIWEDKYVGRAMQLLMEKLPDLRIIDFNGYYDLITPAPGSYNFWREIMKDRQDKLVSYIHREVIPAFQLPSLEKGTVTTYTLPMGHQLNRYSDGARGKIGETINALLVKLREDRR